jgi:hypothetical protein
MTKLFQGRKKDAKRLLEPCGIAVGEEFRLDAGWKGEKKRDTKCVAFLLPFGEAMFRFALFV